MSPPTARTIPGGNVHSEDLRAELQNIVLTQVRDSLALMNSSLTKLDEKVDHLSEAVLRVTAARYDEQITEMKRNAEDYRKEIAVKLEAIDARQRDHDRQVARLGLGMAISGALALASFTAMISKILGVG